MAPSRVQLPQDEPPGVAVITRAMVSYVTEDETRTHGISGPLPMTFREAWDTVKDLIELPLGGIKSEEHFQKIKSALQTLDSLSESS